MDEADYAVLERFGAQDYPEVAGKSVPAQVLLAYLFREHEHPDPDDDDASPVVDSLALDRFIRQFAT